MKKVLFVAACLFSSSASAQDPGDFVTGPNIEDSLMRTPSVYYVCLEDTDYCAISAMVSVNRGKPYPSWVISKSAMPAFDKERPEWNYEIFDDKTWEIISAEAQATDLIDLIFDEIQPGSGVDADDSISGGCGKQILCDDGKSGKGTVKKKRQRHRGNKVNGSSGTGSNNVFGWGNGSSVSIIFGGTHNHYGEARGSQEDKENEGTGKPPKKEIE